MALCECGCGQETKISSVTKKERGWIKGQPKRFVHGHNNRGERSYNWKGGTDTNGRYGRIYAPCHPKSHRGRMYQHILIAEKALGHFLPDRAVVHHVNGDRSDNRSSNLVICENQSYHRLIHKRMRRLYEQRLGSEGISA